jgi:hypothetical protein
MGNTQVSTVDVYEIDVVSVDTGRGLVVAKWNGNPPKTYWRCDWSKWRLKEPMTITTAIGSERLATREEIKAAKAKEKEGQG